MLERNNVCADLDLYMFEKACQWIRHRMDAGLDVIPVSVNQTRTLFYEIGYANQLCSRLKQYNLPANLITLEILESLATNCPETMNDQIKRLRQIGFRISMDDFGSGYSSLNTLHALQIDELKLDRAFQMHALNGRDARLNKILRYTIQLAQSLHMDTVAEGVETKENHQMMRSLGCCYGQGYYYSKPLCAEAFDIKFPKHCGQSPWEEACSILSSS